LAVNANHLDSFTAYMIVHWAGTISDTSRPGFSNVGWHDQFDDEDEDAPNEYLTHWMPLPEFTKTDET